MILWNYRLISHETKICCFPSETILRLVCLHSLEISCSIVVNLLFRQQFTRIVFEVGLCYIVTGS
jgi:hypothetical protein